MAATPWGFRDILPEEAQARERIADSVKGCLRHHGYLPVETPLLENKAALEESGRIADTPFQLFDDDRLLVVRPDNTLSIVRLVSSRMAAGDLPLRLRYEAPVVREQPQFAGASRQFTQLGFELIGVGGADGDAEVVSLAADVLDGLALGDWRIVCGSVTPFQELLARCDAELSRRCLAAVHTNDLVDLDEAVAASDEPDEVKRAISQLPRVHGGAEALDQVEALLAAAGVRTDAVDGLRELYRSLTAGDSGDSGAAAGAAGARSRVDGLARRLRFDFSLMNSFDYYTGLVLKAYAPGLPDPVGSGGRYDSIFDGAIAGEEHVPAAGFAFSLERLDRAGGAQPDAGDPGADGGAGAVASTGARPDRGPLRIAVPKGSLKAGTLEALEAVGLDVESLRDPGRHLIVTGRDTREGEHSIGEVEYVIVRPTDAPAFVACGGADCGICGRDSLIEANLRLLQLVDLKYGACRFIEAEPAWRAGEAERAYARRGTLRVATKYPRIAAAWYASRGVNAEIVSLHGNIELGPIVGMTDRIVDITATGATLRDNDLAITGEIMDCTARFFVNPGRAQLDPRLRELGDRLAAYMETRTASASDVVAGGTAVE